MIIGALLDVGLPLEYLRTELNKLPFKSYELVDEQVVKQGIKARKFGNKILEVIQARRNLQDIHNVIEQSELSQSVKDKSMLIFERLAMAEAKVHGIPVQEIRFHEVGTDETILDILGTVVGLEYLGIKRIFASELHVGTGFIRCSHGILPVPAPATAELLKNIPFYSGTIKGELVTPAGAALVSTLAESFGPLSPEFKVQQIAYGAGGMELEIPHVVRMYAGTMVNSDAGENNQAKIIETNIDDMNPQLYGYITEKLLEQGVSDVYLTPVIMKKGRPGTKMTVMVSANQVDDIIDIILRETTSLGVRILACDGFHLEREFTSLETPWGEVKVKIGKLGGRTVNVAPEFEICKKIARSNNVSLKAIYQYVAAATTEHFSLQ